MNRFHLWHALTYSLSAVFLFLPAWTGIDKITNVSLQETPINAIHNLAWSPDGSQIAVGTGVEGCGADYVATYSIRILDTKTGEDVISLIGSHCATYALDWSPDSTKIAATTFENMGVRIWDVSTGQVLMTGQIPTQGYVSVKWHPGGEKIVVTDDGGGAYLLDSATGQLLNALNFTGAGIDWSPDGNRLVSASAILQENKVKVFDTLSNSIVFTSLGGVGYADWSPDGAKLLSGSLDNTIHIWEANSGIELLTLSGHTDHVNEAIWNPDSRRVASVSDDGTVRIWDVETGEVLKVIEVGSRVFAVAWSPDGSQLAYGGLEGTLTIVSVADIVSATSTPIPMTADVDMITPSPTP